MQEVLDQCATRAYGVKEAAKVEGLNDNENTKYKRIKC
jgi:hypothetical protein